MRRLTVQWSWGCVHVQNQTAVWTGLLACFTSTGMVLKPTECVCKCAVADLCTSSSACVWQHEKEMSGAWVSTHLSDPVCWAITLSWAATGQCASPILISLLLLKMYKVPKFKWKNQISHGVNPVWNCIIVYLSIWSTGHSFCSLES